MAGARSAILLAGEIGYEYRYLCCDDRILIIESLLLSGQRVRQQGVE
jgi:hypothetical protein